MLKFGKTRERALRQYLRYLGHRHAVLGYSELQGLLYAISCAPDPLAEQEWLELVWLCDRPSDPGDSAAMDIVAFRHLMNELREHIVSSANYGQHLPFTENPDENQLERIARWCDGFLLGHHHLEATWDRALAGLADRSLEKSVNQAVVAAGRLADWNLGLRRLETRRQKIRCFRRLRQLLSVYHSIHALWRAVPDRNTPAAGFARLQPPAADDLCCCGSGKLFRHCCLH